MKQVKPPSSKGGDELINEERVVAQFDSFIIRCLSNELKSRIRARKSRDRHIVIFSDMKSSEKKQLYYNDTYSQLYRSIKTIMFDAMIQDELLYEALLRLKPQMREIIVLKYWGRYSDQKIGSMLKMSRRTVCRNKNKALRLLKNIIEEMKECEERLKF